MRLGFPFTFRPRAAAPLALAALALGPAEAARTYFPSAPGTTWKLTNGETQKLGPVVTIRGVAVTPLQHIVGGKLVSEDLLEYKPKGGGVFLRGVRVAGQVTWYDAPLTVYPSSPLAIGQTWTSSTGSVNLTARVTGQQPVVVPAGKFNALVIQNDVVTASGATNSSLSYFVPGVGTVRYTGASGANVDLTK